MWLPLNPPRYWTPAWAGPLYVAEGRTLQTVRGTFRVPIPQKHAPIGAQVDVWAGLGGVGHPVNLCQAGVTLEQTAHGVVGWLFAWDYPHQGHDVLGVQPGDVITVTAGWLGTRWGATATDRRTGQTVTLGCAAPRGGGWHVAEWVTENHVWNHAAPWLPTTAVWFRHMSLTRTRPGRGTWDRAWWPDTVTRFVRPETAEIRAAA